MLQQLGGSPRRHLQRARPEVWQRAPTKEWRHDVRLDQGVRLGAALMPLVHRTPVVALHRIQWTDVHWPSCLAASTALPPEAAEVSPRSRAVLERVAPPARQEPPIVRTAASVSRAQRSAAARSRPL